MRPSRAVATLVSIVMLSACVGPRPGGTAVTSPPATPLPARGEPASDEAKPGIVLAGTPRQGALLAGRLSGARQLTLDGAPVRVAPDGAFIIGFGRDSGPEAILRATLPGGGTIERRLAVAPRAWPTEIVSSVMKRPLPDAEFARVRAGEVAQITAARAIDSASDGWRQAFRWPATGRISGVFGAQRVYKGGERGDPHSGVDIAVPTGTPIVAPADGVVILAADHPFTLEGNLLMIDHGMGLNSAFLHLSRIDVKVGDVVRQGQPIGLSGATGRASGPHLHWAIKWLDRRLDPATISESMRSTGAGVASILRNRRA